ncbi:hypothetical protein A3762_01615 [Oleiphilus sp. HI0125]|nr:iron-sulfur cluster-binding domain-containing protein [Oleiphilus sp. HI0125]KZZ55696.1 hypothetical protein A3762_01615 [Oleiphilus sp. HI0125]
MLRTFSPKQTEQLAHYLTPIRQLLSPNYKRKLAPAKVLFCETLDDECISLRLKVSHIEKLAFKPGQHFQLSFEINGRFLTRTFSAASTPKDLYENKVVEFYIKKIPDGTVTSFIADELKAGDMINIAKAQGSFVISDNSSSAMQLFLAAGSGISPILSMLKSLPREELTKHKAIWYQRGNVQSPATKSLRLLAENGLDLKIIDTEINNRISDKHLEHALSEKSVSDAYICGPIGFIQTAGNLLQQRAKKLNQTLPSIYSETFVIPKISGSTSEHTITVNKNATATSIGNEPILDSLESAGHKPVFGCRAGACHQCSATLLSGSVKNVLTDQTHREHGEKIQICCSFAESDLEIEIQERVE